MTDEQNIEIESKEPDLDKMEEEIQQAITDSNHYYQRLIQARDWWCSRWPGQTIDGRKHTELQGQCFPWEGACDSRLRTIATLIKEHVSVSKFAFFKAKIQCTAVRPMIQEGQADKATKLLRWRIYNHMWQEILREVPLAFNWRWGYGVAVMNVEWDQQRRLERYPISLQDLQQLTQLQGSDGLAGTLVQALMDPEQEDSVTTLLQTISHTLSRPDARKIVKELR